MFNRIRIYVGGLVVLAAITSAWVYDLSPAVDGASFKAANWFGLLCGVSGLLAYKKAALRQTGSIAFLPMLASVVVAPSWVTIACLGLATCLVEIAAKRAVIKATFNIAQAIFWVGIAILAFRYLGGEALRASGVIGYPAFIGALAAFAFVHSAALAGVISISEDKSFLAVWWSGARVTVVADLVMLPFVYACALLYVNWGPVGAVAFMILALGYREINKVNWQLQQTNQELLQLMVAAIEARDPYTSGHSRRVSLKARFISQSMGRR